LTLAFGLDIFAVSSPRGNFNMGGKMITHFYDMHSGGGAKEAPYEHIFIEAPEEEAVSVFYARFGHSPHRVSCTCCGSDYSVSEYATLEDATVYHREGYKYPGSMSNFERVVKESVSDYLRHDDVLFIPAEVIDEGSRHWHVPEEGYIWH
jgi:hypothetical protein